MHNLSDYITEYVSSGRGAYRMEYSVNDRLEELNKFMNSDPVALEACIAKIGRYHVFEVGYMPRPWVFYFDYTGNGDSELDKFDIRIERDPEEGRIWVCNGENRMGDMMRVFGKGGKGSLERITIDDPSEIQINMTIKDALSDYAEENFLEPGDEISSVWKDDVAYSIIGLYGTSKMKKEKDSSMTISLNDFDGGKMIKAFDTVDNKKFWERLVIN